MTETQSSICTCADATFGVPVSNASIAAQALVKVAELVTAIVNGEPAERIGVEIADVMIVLARLGRSLGVDVIAMVDRGDRLRASGTPTWLAARATELLARKLRELGSEDRITAFDDRDLMAVVGVLVQLGLRLAVDLSAAIDAKMAVNRARKWVRYGNGDGRHVEEGK